MKLFVDFIVTGGIVITLLILFLLIKSKGKELPQKLLILFFSSLLFYLINGYAESHDVDILYALTFLFNDGLEIFLGPIIYIYIKSLFEDNRTLIRKNWGHFLPTLIYLGFISIPFFISLCIERFVFSYLKFLNDNILVAFTIFMLYLVLYILLSLRLFYKYKRAMFSNFSTLEEKNFTWVRQMLLGTLFISTIDFIFSLYELINGEFQWDTGNVTLISVIILIVYLGYFGINQSKILIPDFLINVDPNNLKPKENNSHLSSLSEIEIIELQRQLESVLIYEKPYLDEDLTLGKLANMINTSDKKLSALLNKKMKTTFYDLVNKFRVDAVKEKLNLEEFQNLTLLGIAYESGFKSKTSFNRIFKKETGLTPSEYKKKHSV